MDQPLDKTSSYRVDASCSRNLNSDCAIIATANSLLPSEFSYACTDILYHSFLPRTISQWNSLPQSVTSCPSLLSFKHNYWSYASQ